MSAHYVYVASSWRNHEQPAVVGAIRNSGIEAYDFRNPPGGTGFSWRDVGGHRRWTPGEQVDTDAYLEMVNHPRAREGFHSDFHAMQSADAFVLVLPCGKSAHLELGWAAGAGVPTCILLEDETEPELMYRMVDYFARSTDQVIGWLHGLPGRSIQTDLGLATS